MAKQIEAPKGDGFGLRDWHLSLYRTAVQSGGFICLELTNMNGPGKPEIKAGSRFELNNSVFVVGPENEAVKGDAVNGQNYIYARYDGNADNIPGSVVSPGPPLPLWQPAKAVTSIRIKAK